MSNTLEDKIKDFSKIKQALEAKRKELRKEATEMASKFFKENTGELFKEHPIMKSFSWEQFTPYFNDGDTCVFRARTDEDSIKINGEHWDDWWYRDEKDATPEQLQKTAAVNAVSKFLNLFSKEDFEAAFGDHTSVVVTPDSIEVIDCTDHY